MRNIFNRSFCHAINQKKRLLNYIKQLNSPLSLDLIPFISQAKCNFHSYWKLLCEFTLILPCIFLSDGFHDIPMLRYLAETQKVRLVNVFERLEILINEFAKIEQLLSKSYSLNYQDYHFSLILEQVRDMSMLDNWDELISENIECDAVINVDFGL